MHPFLVSRSARRLVALAAVVAVALALFTGAVAGCQGSAASSGGTDGGSTGFDFDATPESSVSCTNLECQIKSCIDDPAGTRLIGTVYDPSGERPVYNAVVYVPNEPLAPIAAGASCERCDRGHSGAPLRITATDANGRYELDNVPAGENIPLVVQIGKWRRTTIVREVPLCTETTVNVGLPRNRGEGDIPRIALVTGAADPLPCLLRKMGIDDSELGIAGSDARIHLYRGGGYDAGDGGAPRVASGSFASGPAFPNAESLWNDVTALSKYDAVLLACEGAPDDDAQHKSPAAKQALYDYAKAGGRVLATHYHHTFFSGSPDPAAKSVALWSDRLGPAADPATTSVETDVAADFPKAIAMRAWLAKQNALSATGKLALLDARHDVDGVDAGARAWLQAANPGYPGAPAIQHLTFGAPVGAREDQVCGRVAFTNVHVGVVDEGSLHDDATKPFPTSCQTKTMTPQQKALEFLLYDLVSCAQAEGAPLVRPH
jgi:hypothetical protein